MRWPSSGGREGGCGRSLGETWWGLAHVPLPEGPLPRYRFTGKDAVVEGFKRRRGVGGAVTAGAGAGRGFFEPRSGCGAGCR